MTDTTTLTLTSTDKFCVGGSITIHHYNNGFFVTLWRFITRKPAPKQDEELVIVSIDSEKTLTVKRK